MQEFVEVFYCDELGANCTGPYLEPLTRWEEILLPSWLDVTDPFYQLFVGVTLGILVTAGIVRIVGKFAFYT